MDLAMFDIFSGSAAGTDATWLEAVTSLANARQRREEIASKSPDQHFVFSQATHSVVARSDTRLSVSPSPESQSESG